MQLGSIWKRAIDYDSDRLRVSLEHASSRRVAILIAAYHEAICALTSVIAILECLPPDTGSDALEGEGGKTSRLHLTWAEVCILRRHADVGVSLFLELFTTAQAFASERIPMLTTVGKLEAFARSARESLIADQACLRRRLTQRGASATPTWTTERNSLFVVPEGQLLLFIDLALNIADRWQQFDEPWRLGLPISALGVAAGKLLEVYEKFVEVVEEVRSAGNSAVPFPFVPPEHLQ